MAKMKKYYPKHYDDFMKMADHQKIVIPNLGFGTLNEMQRLFQASIMHEKPLTNALGPDFKNKLTRETTDNIFQSL